jgi:hypothetical protein
VVRCQYEQGDELGCDRDDGDNADDEKGHISHRIAQHVGDPVVRDAAQAGLYEHQLVEQADHRNGDHDHQQLHGPDDEHVEQRTAPGRPMCGTERTEDAHRLDDGLWCQLLLSDVAPTHLASLTRTPPHLLM